MAEALALESVRAPAHVEGSAMLMRIIERAATDQAFDVGKLEKLLEVRERWEANEARKAYVAAMNSFKATPPTLEKNKHVKFGNTEYDHATLDQVCDVIGKALSQHGLSHRWEVEQGEHERITVACVLTHELGHSERVSMSATPDKSGSKNSIQAIGSAVTYLQRYTLLAATGLAAKEQDDDGKSAESAEPISAAQKDQLIALFKETGANTKAFLEYYEIGSLDELPASRFADAKAKLSQKKAGAK